MKCDVCGTETTCDGITLEGVEIKLTGKHKEVDRVVGIFGKTEFHICFVCWLLSLGLRTKTGNFFVGVPE